MQNLGLMYIGLLIAATGFAASADDALVIRASNIAGPEWSHNMPIYEVALSNYTEAGTIQAFEQELPRIRDLGVGVIWFMPINPSGEIGPRRNPYCVKDYYAVDPLLGSPDDFKRLVRRIHELGMYVMLGFVPNHTSRDHPFIKERPELYVWDENGQVGQVRPWRGLAQFDYSNREIWKYMLDAHLHWIREFDVDGFREDVAGRIPMEHWQWLRPRIEKVKPLMMLAEDHRPRNHPEFDLTYDWSLPVVMWQIAWGKEPATAIDDLLRSEQRRYPPGAVRMRFLTNHDMQNSGYLKTATGLFSEEWLRKTPLWQKYRGGHEAFAVLIATLPGRPMILNGQEIGNTKRIDYDKLGHDRIQWVDNPELREFYTKLLRAYRDNPAIWGGDFIKVRSSDDAHVYAFVRRRGDDRALVVVNLSDQERLISLNSGAITGQYTELFTNEIKQIAHGESMTLGAWAYRIYVAR